MRVRLTDIRDHSVRELDLTPDSRDMAGWQSGVSGWSIGQKGSGAAIELDEALGDCRVGVFTGSFQVLIWGMAKDLPGVWLLPQGRSTGSLVPFEPERWLVIERAELRRVAMGGDVHLRFDQSPIRFGNYILESLRAPEAAQDCCGFCAEPLRTYFRVGSQQACPACTEKFMQATRATLDRNYWRALRAGVLAALAGGITQAVLISVAHVFFGSIAIGILVGIAMRRASKESAGTRHRLTAVILTLVASLLPWSGGNLLASLIYLAIGMFAAWALTGRNVRTEIHGPYQAKGSVSV